VIVAGAVCASAGTVQINRNATRVATIVERSGPATEEDRGQGGQWQDMAALVNVTHARRTAARGAQVKPAQGVQ
jgi:hypothetical protein